MKFEELLSAYKQRVVKERLLNAILLSITISLILNLLCLIVFLILGVKYFLVNAIILSVSIFIFTPIFYLTRFKVTDKIVAKKLDQLGLEERVITALNYSNDLSHIAKKQREDTETVLKTVNKKAIKLAISIPFIICCLSLFILNIGAITAAATSDKPILDSMKELLDSDILEYEVQYEVDGDVGGIIEGDIFQIVSEGEVPSPVMAIAEDGYVFYGWSDGAEDPYRADGPVTGKLVVYAVFVEVEESDDGNGGEGEEGQEGDGSGKGEGEGDGDGSGEGEGDQNGDGEGGGMGGSSVPNNQVIDGGTYYGDEYKSSYSDAQDALNSSSMEESSHKVISDYFHSIAK